MLGVGSSTDGASFIELSVPLAEFSRYLDFSKRVKAQVVFGTHPMNGWYGLDVASSSPDVDIVIGE
jgi:hypothetical protein